MKAAAKKLPAAIAGAVLTLSFSLLPLAHAYADQLPYFKAYQGDVNTGGWFNNGPTSCTDPSVDKYFQDDNFTPDGVTKDAAKSYGGIYAFARNTGSGRYGGASSQYDAFSLGSIDGGGGSGTFGFFTSNIGSSAGVTYDYNALSFGNSSMSPPAGYWGGLWGGGQRYSTNCIPDYYGTKDSTPTDAWPGSLSSGNLTGTHTYVVDTGGSVINLLSGNVNVAAGARIAVFVKGDLHINGNVTFASHTDTTKFSRFTVVVKGNISVDPNVTNLDGIYIAQPDMSSSNPFSDYTGTFWTCDDGNRSAFTIVGGGTSWIVQNCQNKLTINGAVIAKEFFLFRVKGDLPGASFQESPASGNIAEVFNYTPDTVLAGPILPDGSSDSVITGTQPYYDSVLSLPPTF
jgi:hypothetical protein